MKSETDDRQDLEARYRRCVEELSSRNQGHVLRWWEEISTSARRQLLSEIEAISWSQVDPLIETHVRQRPPSAPIDQLEPAPVWPAKPEPGNESSYREARNLGEELIRTGKVAAFTVAGGQGTRLGYEGPKGTVPVTPVRKKTLFQLFAEMIDAAGCRYGVKIPWYIMTSPENHGATRDFFETQSYFGLRPTDVVLFRQGTLPLFDFEGRILMRDRARFWTGPDGHGGSLKALRDSGSLADMERRGIETIAYFQVDNPLIKLFDPLFIGLHAQTSSEMSTKVTPKAHDQERVGNLCLRNGRISVVEYSEFPAALAIAKNSNGSRKFDASNLAIHAISVSFLNRIVGSDFQLPFRRAEKVVEFQNEQGEMIRPETPNAVKLEMFVFDAIPLAKDPLLLQVDRAEEFSPVKNAAGDDSLESAIRDQNRRACRWMQQAGVEVPIDSSGEPAVVLEIAPSAALEAGDLMAKRGSWPTLKAGTSVYLG